MEVVLQILQTVLIVSFVTGIVWVTGKVLGKKAGYRWRKILWFILAIRLIIPFSVDLGEIGTSFQPVTVTVDLPGNFSQRENSAPHSSLGDLDRTQKDGNSFSAEQAEPSLAVENRRDDGISPAKSEENVDNQEKNAFSGWSAAEWVICIWLLGACLMLVLRLFQYRNIRRKSFRKSCLCQDFVIIRLEGKICREMGISKMPTVRIMSDSRTSPMLFGYVDTVLFLPDIEYTEEEWNLILRHELTHYAGKDLWYKLLLVIVCDIYWFNPIFRLMKAMAFQDVEYVCDEKATKNMDAASRKSYSNAILRTMSQEGRNSIVFTTQFGGSKKNMKKRIENIFSVHSKTASAGALCLAMAVLISGTVGIHVTVKGSEGESETIQEKSIPETESEAMASADLQEKETFSEDKTEAAGSGVISIESGLVNPDDIPAEWIEKYPDYEVTQDDRYFQWTDEYLNQMPTSFSVGASRILLLAEEGDLADITDLLESRGWLDQMNDTALKMVSDENGRVYGIPISMYTFGLAVNKELFKEAGLTDEQGEPVLPETWDELAQDAVRIKESTGAAGLCLIAEDVLGSIHFYNLAWNFGATDLATKQGELSGNMGLDSEAAIQAMEFVKSLRWDYDVLTEEPTKEDYMTGLEHLADNTAAMYIMPSDILGYLDSYGVDPEKIAFGSLPAGSQGKRYSYYEGSNIVFSKDALPDEIDAVLSLLDMQGIIPMTDPAGKEQLENNISMLKGDPIVTNAQYQSELGSEVCSVLHSVVTDSNADVETLMKKAAEQMEKILDAD